MRRIFCFLALIFCATMLPGCSQNKKPKVTILFDRVDNLEKGSKAYLKGVAVGEVSHLELFGDSVLVDIQLEENATIPAVSKFIIRPSMIGNSTIVIESSNNKLSLTNTDTVHGTFQQRKILDEIMSDSVTREKLQQLLDTIGKRMQNSNTSLRDTIEDQ